MSVVFVSVSGVKMPFQFQIGIKIVCNKIQLWTG